MASVFSKFNGFIRSTNYLRFKKFNIIPSRHYIFSSNNDEGINEGRQRLHYKRVGSGPHAVLCLPGALGTIETDFGAQFQHLNKEKFTIVSWDPPGYGQSRPPNRDFSIGVQRLYKDARLAHWMMKELNHKNFSVLGWSEGGRTGMILAAAYPKAVRNLVTWGGSAFLTQDDIDKYMKVRDIDTWSPKMHSMMSKVYGEEFFRKIWSDWVDTHAQILARGGDICRNQLGKIKCPTLILHGVKDPLVDISHMEFIHERIVNSEMYLVTEGKHNLHVRFYEEFNSLVEEFLTREDFGRKPN